MRVRIAVSHSITLNSFFFFYRRNKTLRRLDLDGVHHNYFSFCSFCRFDWIKKNETVTENNKQNLLLKLFSCFCYVFSGGGGGGAVFFLLVLLFVICSHDANQIEFLSRLSSIAWPIKQSSDRLTTRPMVDLKENEYLKSTNFDVIYAGLKKVRVQGKVSCFVSDHFSLVSLGWRLTQSTAKQIFHEFRLYFSIV